MKRALISVSDKSNIVEFAKSLVANNFEIISTGGTFKMLKEAGGLAGDLHFVGISGADASLKHLSFPFKA